MHPLKTEQPYPYEQWWIAALAAEVGRDLLGRTILGERILLYRTEAGEAVAASGLCTHRAYPLEAGRLVGDNVQCGYHGFTFDPSGSCVLVPSQEVVPGNSELRSYPIVERGGLIWVWTGSPEKADPALLPDLESMGLSNPDWAVEYHPVVTIDARYTLLIDNLMDLSHVSFIHTDTIPAGDALAALPIELIEDEGSINALRLARSLPKNPLFEMQFPGCDGPFDVHFDAESYGPMLIRTGGESFDASTGRSLGSQNFLHGMTPESPTRVHYFVATARSFGVDDPVLGNVNLDMGTKIQPQDIAALEAIESMLRATDGSIREVSVRADHGGLKVRRRLERQIAAEG